MTITKPPQDEYYRLDPSKFEEMVKKILETEGGGITLGEGELLLRGKYFFADTKKPIGKETSVARLVVGIHIHKSEDYIYLQTMNKPNIARPDYVDLLREFIV